MTVPSGAVIELGERHGAVAPPPWRPRVPRWWRPRRWLSAAGRLVRRPWRAAAVAATLLLALFAGGAGPLPVPPLRLVAQVPITGGAQVAADGDRLMVLGDGPVLAAYSLAGGARLWRTPLAGTGVSGGTVRFSDGVVLFTADLSQGDRGATVALDEATGRVLWRSRSVVEGVLDDAGAALMLPIPDSRLDLVDLRTGATRWSGSYQDCQFSLDVPTTRPGARAFALLCGYAHLGLTIVDLRSGAQRRAPLTPTRDLPRDGSSDAPVEPQMVSAGGAIVVERPDGPTTVVEGYRWSDGRRIWARPGFGAHDLLMPCAGGVCVVGPDAGAVLDPATGVELPLAAAADPRTQVSATFAPAGGRVPGDGDPRTLLLVPPDRTPLYLPSALTLPAGQPGIGVPLGSFPSAGSGSDSPAPAGTEPPPPVVYASVLVEVLAADGTQRPLRRLPGIAPQACVAELTYLICPTSATLASVWQYPP